MAGLLNRVTLLRELVFLKAAICLKGLARFDPFTQLFRPGANLDETLRDN
jgi:hypothetical protein